ncbi:class I SAM-dependent methyltransferase [Nonomuraea sp. NPDC050540]|uniref:class I SAM-dependent methyltransferase n=1 Tax=Nonomuraea sp. NPDC050540 TaxID=3364367 RepID=UPI0037BD1ECC
MTTSTVSGIGLTRWPSLTPPDPAPVRAWLMARVFRRAVASLPVRVALPGGTRMGGGGPDSPVMRIVRPREFFTRLAVRGPIGLGEAYMSGDWTSTDLAGLLTPPAARLTRSVSRPFATMRRWVAEHKPASERNTVEGAQSNIRYHYDLPSELFALFLDDSMTYSCAWFGPGDDLHRAQSRKIEGMLDYALIGPGSRVLEIGTGWGELAIAAARRGADVTTLTISPSQCALAGERVAAAGVGDRVRVLRHDYREAEGTYDAIVSVEMLEAVGAEFWGEYFAVLRRVLAPGGRIALQTITMPHDRMLATRDLRTWITTYVFPGGQVPSLTAIEDLVEPGLTITGRRRLGSHYARTLQCWRERFIAREAEVADLGFDEIFLRLWEFYLAQSEAGFRAGYLDVWQLQLAETG